jgi:N-acetylmuramoyl-L-alanine amidase
MTAPTIAPKTAQRIRRVAQATSLLTMALVFVSTSAAHALSNKQVRAFDRGAYYYNTEVCGGNGDKGVQKTIVIDPGHSGKSITTQDESGLKDFDYPNPSEAKPLENEEMMYVALNLKKKLASDGYRVVLTKGNDLDADDAKTVRSDAVKKGARESVSLRERANIANAQNADLAISLHDDHGQQWDWAELYTQKVGLYREGSKGKVEFTDKAVATESQRIGKIFQEERGKAEKHTVQNKDADFGGREGLDGGNIPQVMLYAQVPWVYNEVGAAPVGQHLSQEHLDQYVDGNYQAIKKALPVVAGGTTNLSGKDNIEKSFRYFVSKGLSDLQAAAIIGNLMVEGGAQMDPKQVEIRGDGITRADKPIRNRGYGIAQWTFPSRQEGLEAMAAKQNKGPGDLGVQLDFLWKELNSNYKGALEDLRKQKDIAQAVESFQNKFENPADKQGSLKRRTDYAKAALKAYGSGNEGGTLTAEDDTTGTATCTGGGDAAINCDDPTLTTSDMSNTRKNVVCLAKKELKAWKDGELTPGTDFQKYMVKEDGKKGKQEHSWCAEFAGWIFYKAGYPFHGGSDGGWRMPWVGDVVAMGNKDDKFKTVSAKGYTPKPGDMAIYQGGSNLTPPSKLTGGIKYEHISIVTEVKGNAMTIIGGNQSGGNGGFGEWYNRSRVSENKLTRGSNGGYNSYGQTVIGFVTPKD